MLNTRGASVSHYQYDTNGHRIIKTENHLFGNHETIGFYTKSGDLLMEHDLKHKKSIKYIYFNGHKVVKIEQAQSSKTNKNDKIVEYYYNDAIGSPVAMADSKGNILWHQIYEPYGITYLSKNNKSNNKFLFAGKEKDETGLSYFGARYYSSGNGRFMSPDPVDVNPESPNTFNRYIYANNNPYKYVDPDGRFALSELPSFPEPFVNAVAGFGDGISSVLTFGLYSTKDVRNSLDIGSVDYNSKSYSLGNFSGMTWGLGTYWAAGLNGGSNSVFWSGTGNMEKAGQLGTSLESTPIGSLLNYGGKYVPYNIWKLSSATYAANARGTAIKVGLQEGRIWSSIEKPILQNRNINIIYEY